MTEERTDIVFEGKSYPVRHVEVKGFGVEPIAPISLQDALLKNDAYVSNEARIIDEEVFFFVEDSVFNRYTTNELSAYVSRNVL